MFGYVKANKPELKIKEFEAYKGVYCSLCRELSKEYGPFAKYSLNYDFVFMALLLIGAKPQCSGFNRCSCRFIPLKKCNMLKERNEQLKYVAAVAMMMSYYKVKDNILDSGFFKKIKYLLVYPVFALAKNKAAKKLPQINELIKNAMSKQIETEKSEFKGIDACADATAKVLGELFEFDSKDEKSKRVLNRLGYCIGKWIYIIDAVDDIDDDIKQKSFNPFIIKYKLTSENIADKAFYDEAESQLNVCICEIASAFELLNIYNFKTVINNIIYLGLPMVQTQIINKKNEKQINRKVKGITE